MTEQVHTNTNTNMHKYKYAQIQIQIHKNTPQKGPVDKSKAEAAGRGWLSKENREDDETGCSSKNTSN